MKIKIDVGMLVLSIVRAQMVMLEQVLENTPSLTDEWMLAHKHWQKCLDVVSPRDDMPF